MSKKASELVLERNFFYYKYARQINMINLLYLIVLFLLIGFYVYYSRTISSKPVYFATTPAGVIINNPPLAFNHLSLEYQAQFVDQKTDYIYNMPEPKISFTKLQTLGDDGLVIHWVNQALLALFDYDYVHYRRSIQSMRKYFNTRSYNEFLQALNNSRTILAVKARSAVVIPSIVDTPKITQVRLISGRVAWDVEAIILIKYDSLTQEPLLQRIKAVLTIARFPTYVTPFYGLAIVRSNFSDYNGE